MPASLRKRMRRGGYEIRADTAFREVMLGCRAAPRPGQDGTWITPPMIAGYEALHRLGYAHSIEAWQDGELVGGLYGVSLGNMFTGESMFARAPDASKVAFATLLGNFVAWGFAFVDCEVYTDHLARFGAAEWPRRRFLDALGVALTAPTRRGPWTLELDPREAVQRLPRSPGYRPLITSQPMNGRSTSGTITLPSSCWYCSRMATTVRPTASAEPLSVCTSRGFALGSAR